MFKEDNSATFRVAFPLKRSHLTEKKNYFPYKKICHFKSSSHFEMASFYTVKQTERNKIFLLGIEDTISGRNDKDDTKEHYIIIIIIYI